MKYIIILLTFTLVSCSTKEKTTPDNFFALVDNFETKTEKRQEKSYGFTQETKVYIDSKRFSRLVKIDRDKDGIFEDYMQVFYKKEKPILNLYKMKVEGFSVFPFRSVSISVTDLPGTDKTLLVIMDFETKSFIVYEKREDGIYTPAESDVAKQIYEIQMKTIGAFSELIEAVDQND